MSNAYINKILFGYSKEQVNAEYMDGLLPFMLTEDKVKQFQELSSESEPDPESMSSSTVPEPIQVKVETPNESIQQKRYQPQKNALFWAIYEIEHPKEAFLGTRANAEVEHRLKVVASLKKTPKRLKETNSKLTIEQTQSLLGSMLVAKEDKLEFCVAYAVYYNKPILVVYEKTYCVFSPMVDVDLSEDAILLYASKPLSSKSIFYTSEKNSTPQIINEIINNKVMGPLKTMSNYKNTELDEIASKLHIPTKQTISGKEKRRKKEDIYNDIRVAIHNDTHFI